MSRGDRSEPGLERTPEARELDRQERARRRALREGTMLSTEATGPSSGEPAPGTPDTASVADTRAPAEEPQAPSDAVGSHAGVEVSQAPRETHEVLEQPEVAPVPGADLHTGSPPPQASGQVDSPQSPRSLADLVEPARIGASPTGEPTRVPRIARSRAGRRSRKPSGLAGRSSSTATVRISRGKRSPGARLGAAAALVGVVVILVVLIGSLRGSSHHSATVAPPPVVRVLIPEGQTRIQIAQIAAHDGLTGSYRVASRRSALLRASDYGAPARTADLEGFLFPATYELYVHAPASRLVEEQLMAFREHFASAEIARARALHVTPYQLLIVASMVEREAKVAADRPKIAAVIYNRLAAGMPLGIDATIYYAVELEKNVPTYTRELTESQLHIDSPYNTRTRPGLPPTPISNPGAASIAAAAHPAHVSYRYYVLAADGCGEHVFANTAAEFEADDGAYQAALARNGGRAPSCKRK